MANISKRARVWLVSVVAVAAGGVLLLGLGLTGSLSVHNNRSTTTANSTAKPAVAAQSTSSIDATADAITHADDDEAGITGQADSEGAQVGAAPSATTVNGTSNENSY